MKELLERDAVLNCFHDWIDKRGDVYTADDMQEYRDIEALPIIEQGWIPCSERLPKEEGEYLVSFDDGFIATTGYYEGDFELWADAGEPLAWMPLPESYSGE